MHTSIFVVRRPIAFHSLHRPAHAQYSRLYSFVIPLTTASPTSGKERIERTWHLRCSTVRAGSAGLSLASWHNHLAEVLELSWHKSNVSHRVTPIRTVDRLRLAHVSSTWDKQLSKLYCYSWPLRQSLIEQPVALCSPHYAVVLLAAWVLQAVKW